jgi:hypothetical protein
MAGPLSGPDFDPALDQRRAGKPDHRARRSMSNVEPSAQICIPATLAEAAAAELRPWLQVDLVALFNL